MASASKCRRKRTPSRAPKLLEDGSVSTPGVVFKLLAKQENQVVIVKKTYQRDNTTVRDRLRAASDSVRNTVVHSPRFSRGCGVNKILRRMLQVDYQPNVRPPPQREQDHPPAEMKYHPEGDSPDEFMPNPVHVQCFPLSMAVDAMAMQQPGFQYFDPRFTYHPPVQSIQHVKPPPLPKATKQCACCGTTETPLWRDVQPRQGRKGQSLCNACGIRYKKYGMMCQHCLYVPTKQEHVKSICVRCLKQYT
mmetsp:Transcript_82829/g.115047  ORF Transcript_82829/g.115047 Transcript_82829/m.115047 type:complete len:249 (+) Transcript_82829:237-983(+)